MAACSPYTQHRSPLEEVSDLRRAKRVRHFEHFTVFSPLLGFKVVTVHCTVILQPFAALDGFCPPPTFTKPVKQNVTRFMLHIQAIVGVCYILSSAHN